MKLNYLFKLLKIILIKKLNNLLKKNIKIKVIGNIKPFPKKLKIKY